MFAGELNRRREGLIYPLNEIDTAIEGERTGEVTDETLGKIRDPHSYFWGYYDKSKPGLPEQEVVDAIFFRQQLDALAERGKISRTLFRNFSRDASIVDDTNPGEVNQYKTQVDVSGEGDVLVKITTPPDAKKWGAKTVYTYTRRQIKGKGTFYTVQVTSDGTMGEAIDSHTYGLHVEPNGFARIVHAIGDKNVTKPVGYNKTEPKRSENFFNKFFQEAKPRVGRFLHGSRRVVGRPQPAARR